MSVGWIKNISDETLLRDLLIPGTHDTMTGPCQKRYYKTQTLSLSEQLEAGVRYLDIRLTRDLYAAHREWKSDIGGETILETLKDFLNRNPEEFVLVRFQNANEKKDDFDRYCPALKGLVGRYSDLFFGFSSAQKEKISELTVGRLRGKVLAFECSPHEYEATRAGALHWAYPWHDCPGLAIQDLWDGPAVEEKIAAATNALDCPAWKDRLVLNHISATNGEPGYPDAYAAVLNETVLRGVRDLAAGSGRLSGVLIFDFVTEEIAEKIIKKG